MLRGPLPYQLQLLYYNDLICGATLISSSHAISAAHCFWNDEGEPLDDSKFLVRSGVLDNNGKAMETRRIKYVIKEFDGSWINGGGKPDFVILYFRRPFTLVEGLVQPACLPSKPVKHGDTCYTSGWGQISYPEAIPANNIKVAKMKIMDPLNCDNGNFRHELNF